MCADIRRGAPLIGGFLVPLPTAVLHPSSMPAYACAWLSERAYACAYTFWGFEILGSSVESKLGLLDAHVTRDRNVTRDPNVPQESPKPLEGGVRLGQVLRFIDLGGHEKYLKTALYGLTCMLPDHVLLCVCPCAGMNRVTREHLAAALALDLPLAILLTKVTFLSPSFSFPAFLLLAPVQLNYIVGCHILFCPNSQFQVARMCNSPSVSPTPSLFLPPFLSVLPSPCSIPPPFPKARTRKGM